ncbi:molybdopterin synthase subunit MoaD [Rhodothalassium salexigens DSM 2132]|uniref:Molybdopterin synthase subunit MoaD n=1 Tax=Rhodothalassium salexigens DSM 2132 TaxID=1188247 RepID=A0A4R2PAC7_RHOSA|nr:molybdopterin converting factor subunit 1 [Rhodothalassium salexigens]MBB4212356.1 molybdopterin synthase sulfur carrier subunit [Rhodothalassium salexigens DSM 2132]MBK1637780.1 molybdopterin converting factor subunit 1 [Rhodothalassium salexigens DSM 2132]TCP32013.1 molybdopterin synthase subunit MoaD [Rhodothalassium salexigens DSM 2132]
MKLLYFAWVRERLGVAEEEVAPPAAVVDVASLLHWLAGRGGAYAAVLGERERLCVAVNQVHARDPATPVGADDEVALFPPVTGG